MGQGQSSANSGARFQGRQFTLSETSITCDDPPWDVDRYDGRQRRPKELINYVQLTTAIPPSIGERSASLQPPESWEDKPHEYARVIAWGVVKLAESRAVSEDRLFRSNAVGRSRSYTLRPTPQSRVPLQWVHYGPGAIPNSLADIPCTDLGTPVILALLNDTMGTEYPSDTPGLNKCLEHFARPSRDFGQLYSYLRPRWSDDFVQLLPSLDELRRKHEKMRRDAFQGEYIRNSRIPPRRVWDLYSNRVLPFFAVPGALPNTSPEHIPENVWTVSHSWVDKQDRPPIRTPINGKEWPVPIPSNTTLDHVRVELLNLGAEYVWLDVLCLRQRGDGEQEDQRKDEWRLDLPTIGYVYAHPDKPSITYFNGLGLPFDASPRIIKSKIHWTKRVWTLQEGTPAWLPGGLTGGLHEDMLRFFSASQKYWNIQHVQTSFPADTLMSALGALRGRFCTTELDRILGLAYILGCTTLPVYDEACSTASAWQLLIKHFPPQTRTAVFIHGLASREPFHLFASWEQFLKVESNPRSESANKALTGSHLRLADEGKVWTRQDGTYLHDCASVGPCIMVQDRLSKDRTSSGISIRKLEFDFEGGAKSHRASIKCEYIGVALPVGISCTLLRIGDSSRPLWLVVQVVGKRNIGREEALEAVLWGAMDVYGKSDNSLPVPEGTSTVVYLSASEARARSTEVEKYLKARRGIKV